MGPPHVRPSRCVLLIPLAALANDVSALRATTVHPVEALRDD
jgi:hypothetical protein